MKFISLLLATLSFASVASAAGLWKQIASENIWPNAPFFREIFVPDKEEYTDIRVYVGTGSVRIQNATLFTAQYTQLPLWSLQGDYRSPRQAEASFLRSKLRSVRLDIRSLEANRPSHVQIYIR
ncbi:hypothetical protein D3C87_972810 [compost metagenome]